MLYQDAAHVSRNLLEAEADKCPTIQVRSSMATGPVLTGPAAMGASRITVTVQPATVSLTDPHQRDEQTVST